MRLRKRCSNALLDQKKECGIMWITPPMTMKAWEQVQIEVGEYISKKNKSTLWANKNNQRNMHVFEAKLFENIDKPLRNRQRITNERTLYKWVVRPFSISKIRQVDRWAVLPAKYYSFERRIVSNSLAHSFWNITQPSDNVLTNDVLC